MRLYFVLFLILFIFPITIFSSEVNLIVTNLQKTYQNATDWQVEFNQSTFVELIEKKIYKKGIIILKKPGKIYIQYKEEFGKLYVSNGKNFWVYTPGDSQVMVYKKASKIVAREALTFLQGLGDVNKEFYVTFVNENELTSFMMVNKKLKLLELTPKNPQSIIQRIILGLDLNGHKVKEMTLFNESGNQTHYIFSNIRFNLGVEDSLFEFKTPKGVKIIKG